MCKLTQQNLNERLRSVRVLQVNEAGIDKQKHPRQHVGTLQYRPPTEKDEGTRLKAIKTGRWVAGRLRACKRSILGHNDVKGLSDSLTIRRFNVKG